MTVATRNMTGPETRRFQATNPAIGQTSGLVGYKPITIRWKLTIVRPLGGLRGWRMSEPCAGFSRT